MYLTLVGALLQTELGPTAGCGFMLGGILE